MANTHKFIVKNGLRADNIEFTDSQSGSHQISLNMLNTDTLNFEGDAGSLFSIADDLTGSVFSVGDISGLPIIDVNGDTHNVTLNQFDGKTMIGGTDSGSVDSDVLNVTGNIRTTGIISSTDSGTFGGDGTTSGITLTDGYIDMRTGTGSPAKIRLYCETNNQHHQTLQAQPHSALSSSVVTLPASDGTLALTSDITVTATSNTTFENKTIDLDNNTLSNIEVDNFKTGIIITQSAGIGSNDNETTIPTSAAVKDYVDNNAGGTNAFTKIKVTGQTDVEASASDELELVGVSGITITTDATNDKITFTGPGGGGSGIALTDLSVSTTSASGGGSLSYDNTTGVFTFAPSTNSGGGGGGITTGKAIAMAMVFG